MKKDALYKGSLSRPTSDQRDLGAGVPGDFYVAKHELMSSGEMILWRDAAKLDVNNPLRDYVLSHPRALNYGWHAPTEESPRFLGIRADGALLIRQDGKEIVDIALNPPRPATFDVIPGFSGDPLYPN